MDRSPPPLSTHELLALYYSLPIGAHLEDRLVAYSLAVQAHCLRPVDPLVRIPLQQLGLPQRIYGALRRAGYSYADEVRCLTGMQLLCIKDFGSKSLSIVRTTLDAHP